MCQKHNTLIGVVVKSALLETFPYYPCFVEQTVAYERVRATCGFIVHMVFIPLN